MAPRLRYEQPNAQVVRLLAEARADGLSFAEAWHEIVRPNRSIVMTTTADPPARALRWPTDRNDREAWRAAIYGAAEGLRRSYYREPMTAAERALVSLGAAFEALDALAADDAASEGIGRVAALPSAA